jgi:hypothetical protein
MINNNLVASPVDQTHALNQTDTYGFVNTRAILNVFSKHGWSEVSQQVGKVKNPEKQGFQKHLIRLENPEFQSIPGLSTENNSRPQLVLLNSHDTSTSLQLMWGLIRIACLNGVIAGTGINGMRLVHSKSIVDRLPTAIDYMLNNFSKFAGQIASLQNKSLTPIEVAHLTKTLYDARLANVHNVKHVHYDNRALRIEDQSSDAYTVFNRLQERLLRGGIHYTYERLNRDLNGNVVSSQLITTSTKRIGAVNSQVKLNQLAYDETLKLVA